MFKGHRLREYVLPAKNYKVFDLHALSLILRVVIWSLHMVNLKLDPSAT